MGASCFGTKTAIFGQSSPRFKQVFMYMAGYDSEEAFDRDVAAYMTTGGYGAKIRCPTLLVQGEFDPLSPLEDAVGLPEELRGPKELWILEGDFHYMWGHPGLGGMDAFGFIVDWLRDALAGKFKEGHRRVKWIPSASGAGPYDYELKVAQRPPLISGDGASAVRGALGRRGPVARGSLRSKIRKG